MNIEKTISAVEKLHRNAVKFAQRRVSGAAYNFTFNGRNYVVEEVGGGLSLEFNTRKIGQAVRWLREYLAN